VSALGKEDYTPPDFGGIVAFFRNNTDKISTELPLKEIRRLS
tara:strand:+ start:130 stop:255 length:126 start_codon:yes stop_codon:yes gene_type:complete